MSPTPGQAEPLRLGKGESEPQGRDPVSPTGSLEERGRHTEERSSWNQCLLRVPTLNFWSWISRRKALGWGWGGEFRSGYVNVDRGLFAQGRRSSVATTVGRQGVRWALGKTDDATSS